MNPWITPIVAIVSALGSLFGRGGGDDNKELQQLQMSLLRDLLPSLRNSLEIEAAQQRRRALLFDPELLGGTAHGSVPLQRAVANLAFGLLPRFARTSALAGLVPLTPEQQRLAQAAPQRRFPRFGFLSGVTMPPPAPAKFPESQ